jgi:hypothetical protein
MDVVGAATARAQKAVETNSLVFKAEPPSKRRPPNAGRARRARPAPRAAGQDVAEPGYLPFSKAIPDLVE